MLLSHKHRNSITLQLQLPHVSHLLVFTDNWNNAFIMRKVIAEILENGFYKKMYVGENNGLSESEMEKCSDCAIVNVTLKGFGNSSCNSEIIEDFFVHELHNKRNAVQFESTVLNEERNLTAINVTIQIAAQEDKKPDTAAA